MAKNSPREEQFFTPTSLFALFGTTSPTPTPTTPTTPTPTSSTSTIGGSAGQSAHQVLVRAFVSEIRPTKTKTFFILRDSLYTIQCVLFSPLSSLSPPPTVESFVEVQGSLLFLKKGSEVRSCVIKNIEIRISSLRILSLASDPLPFPLRVASETLEKKKEWETPLNVHLSTRLDSRFLDLRTPLSSAVFAIKSEVINSFRNFLLSRKFLEIKTPKIIKGASEGGASVFQLSYFGEKACLAQSPQLYKQMAIIGGMKRVFEISPCFRAESSNTHRHLTEFTGVDVEMEMEEGTDLVEKLYEIVGGVVREVQEKCRDLLSVVREYFEGEDLVVPEKMVRREFGECVEMVHGRGAEAEDLSTADERRVGEIVKKESGSDLVVIVGYPQSARPFYTKRREGDGRWTRSFDMVLRGEEVLSGAERVDDGGELRERIRELGIEEEGMKEYLRAFDYGVPPHGGCGIGLERVVKAICGLPDVRYCTMFPRDPRRLLP